MTQVAVGLAWLIWTFRDEGRGLLRQFPPFCYFSRVSIIVKTLDGYWILPYIWQVSSQLRGEDTRQIWKWLKEPKRLFCEIKKFLNEIIKQTEIW